MKIQISLAGLIQVPKQLLKRVQEVARSKLLSYALYSSDRENEHIFNLFDKFGKTHNIDIVGPFEVLSVVEIPVTLEGLPKTYYKFAKDVDTLILGLSSTNDKSNGFFAKPNKIFIQTGELRYLIHRKEKCYYGDIERYFESLDATVEHELSHFIQYTMLHPHNYGRRSKYDSKLEDFDIDDYYNSNVEFDPTIKTEVRRFLISLKSFYGDFRITDVQLNSQIAFFVGAKTEQEAWKLAAPVTTPSAFFQSLKKVRPKFWKKAIRLFSEEVTKQFYKKYNYENQH